MHRLQQLRYAQFGRDYGWSLSVCVPHTEPCILPLRNRNCTTQKKASKAENEKQALAVRAAKALREVEGQVQVLTAAVVAARRAGHSIPQLNL